MKVRQMYVLGLAVAFVLGVCGAAFAADAPATPAPAAKPAPSTPAAPAATPPVAPKADAAKKPAEELTKVTIKGKIESKMVKNKKTGAEAKRYNVIVAEAKGDDGKVIDKFKGKTLRVTGKSMKPEDLDKLVGKDAEIKGEANSRLIKAASIK